MEGSEKSEDKHKRLVEESSGDLESTCCSKVQTLLAKMFSLDKSTLHEVAVLKLALLYLKMLETIHIILLYTVINATNSVIYLLISAIISGAQVVIYALIRFSVKFIMLRMIGLATILTCLAEFAASIFFIMNFVTFKYFCGLLQQYYISNPYYNGTANNICQGVQIYFYVGSVLSIIVIVSRAVAIGFIYKAYRVSKMEFDQNEMKRKRKDKYNELLLKKHVYNKDRIL